MNTFYKILGLEPGASQLEMKKAYFKLIRQHTPESDPEKFQQIREAYEQLRKMGEDEDRPVFPPFSEPWAEKLLEQIEKSRKAGNFALCRDTCEEACRLFPDDIQFLYQLVIAQRQCGNTGKAVKSAERLVSKDPENKWYQRELAVSCMERGFTQKAYNAFEKAYELGCRDVDFILLYSTECRDYGEYDKGIEILFEVAKRDKKWTKEDIPELVEVYFRLLYLDLMSWGQDRFMEIMDGLCKLQQQYSVYIGELIKEFCALFYFCIRRGLTLEKYRRIRMFLENFGAHAQEEADSRALNELTAEICYRILKLDGRFGDTIAHFVDACYFWENDELTLKKFAILDCKLCMIEERDEILSQAKLLKEEFPEFYGELEEFVQRLESDRDLSALKANLQKTYRKWAPQIEGGHYYDKYPQERPASAGKVIYDGMEEQPYVRGAKKIGRNDPCPCGSGKKYKQCCINKNR